MSDTPPIPTPPAPPAPVPTPPTPPPAPPTPPAPPADPAKPVSQADVEAIAKRERAAGRTAQEKAMLEKLGVENIDEAEAALKAYREQQAAQQTAAEKAASDAATAQAKADKATADAAALVRATSIDRALLRAKVTDDAINDAAALVERELLDTKDPDDDAITAAVTAVKTRLPALFDPEGATPPVPPRPPASNPGGTPPVPKPPAGKLAEGMERGKAAAGSRGGVSAMVTASNAGAES